MIWIIAGAILMARPLSGVVVLTAVLGAAFIAEAAVKLVFALRMRPAAGWKWVLFNAVIAGLLGAMIWSRFPSSSLWALGALAGVNILVSGWVTLMLALAAGKSRVPELASAATAGSGFGTIDSAASDIQPNLIHPYTEWARSRLDEIDASIALFESRIQGMKAGTRLKAQEALDDMQTRRTAFQNWIDTNRDADEQAWAAAKAQLHTDWVAFESDVEAQLDAAQDDTNQFRTAFTVRADALTNAWQMSAENMRQSAAAFRADRRADIDKAITNMKSDAKKCQSKAREPQRGRQRDTRIIGLGVGRIASRFQQSE